MVSFEDSSGSISTFARPMGAFLGFESCFLCLLAAVWTGLQYADDDAKSGSADMDELEKAERGDDAKCFKIIIVTICNTMYLYYTYIYI